MVMQLKQLFLEDLKEQIPDEFWGNQGAGILFLSCTTGKVLLTLRSAEVNEPHTWGLVGGKIDPKESPARAARHEAREELGYRGKIENLIPAYTFKTKGFKFHNFIGIVPDEFAFTLDHENDDAKWFDIDDLPEPLHFGLEHLFQNAKHIIKDLIDEKRKQTAGL